MTAILPSTRGASDEDGTYTIGGIPAGTYIVRFTRDNPGIHSQQIYNGSVSLRSQVSPIVVASGSTHAGVDATFPTTAVFDLYPEGGATGPSDWVVLAVDATTGDFLALGFRRMAGYFEIDAIPAGTSYKVAVVDATGTCPSGFVGATPALPGGTVFGPGYASATVPLTC